MLIRAKLLLLGAGALAISVAACSTAAPKKRVLPDSGDGFYDDGTGNVDPPPPPDYVNTDSGAFGVGSREGGGNAITGGRSDAGVTDAGTTEDGAAVKVFCTGPLAANDLAVVELMISSRAGSGDNGEWVEIQSTRDCWLDVSGLRVESPRGAAETDSVTIPAGTELAPDGIFVVADSLDSANNHDLPAPVFSFASTDVLKNDGDTITVKAGATVIDTITYPSFSNLEAGRSISFPLDCAWSDRADWQRWSLSYDVWSAPFKGTPNADNDDVACY